MARRICSGTLLRYLEGNLVNPNIQGSGFEGNHRNYKEASCLLSLLDETFPEPPGEEKGGGKSGESERSPDSL